MMSLVVGFSFFLSFFKSKKEKKKEKEKELMKKSSREKEAKNQFTNSPGKWTYKSPCLGYHKKTQLQPT